MYKDWPSTSIVVQCMAVGSLVVFLHAQLGFQVVSDGHPHLQRNLEKKQIKFNMNWPRLYRYKSGDTLTHQHLNPAIYTILIRYISLTKQKRHLGNN